MTSQEIIILGEEKKTSRYKENLYKDKPSTQLVVVEL
jgi:hypothetical protein